MTPPPSSKNNVLIGVASVAVLGVAGFFLLGPSSSPEAKGVQGDAKAYIELMRRADTGAASQRQAREFSPLSDDERALLKASTFEHFQESTINSDQTRACVVYGSTGGLMADRARVFLVRETSWKVLELQVYRAEAPPKPPFPDDWVKWSTSDHRTTPRDNVCRHGS